MLFLFENIRKYRLLKGYTQEEVAGFLSVTPQSVSKWERDECLPDISLLPALANIFETSIDTLIGMDSIRSEEMRLNIHKAASEFERNGDYNAAEKVYRDALRTYPNKPGMMLGLAGVLALQDKPEEAIELIERGLAISVNEKQKATVRAVLCFLYLKCGRADKASALASQLPHTRESREVIQPLISKELWEDEINFNIRHLLIGE
jgi:Predicted transcriptional regulators